MSELRIANVMVYPNGMVIVFDQHGQQMPEFQGKWSEMEAKIRAANPEHIDLNSQWGQSRTVGATTMKNCTCCFIGCEALAAVEIRDKPPTLEGYTHACNDHVEALTPAGPHSFHLFDVPGDSDTISKTPAMDLRNR